MALKLTIDHRPPEAFPMPSEITVSRHEVFVIGREGCDWNLPDPSLHISERHCEVSRRGTRFVLRDLSTNGTFLNGASTRVDGEAVLKDGARITIGAYAIKVAYVADDLASGSRTALPEMTGTPAEATSAAADRNLDPAEAVSLMSPSAARSRPPQTRILAARAVPDVHGSPKPAVLQPVPDTDARTADPRSLAAEVTPKPPTPKAVAEVDAPVSTNDIHARVAAGLGVPVTVLAGLDAGSLVEELGRVVRLSVERMQARYVDLAASNRRLRRRERQKPGERIFNPLKSRDSDRSLALLFAAERVRPGAISTFIEACAAELDGHFDRYQRAVAISITMLAEEIEPDVLEQACRDRPDAARRREAAWEMFRAAWSDLHDDWQEGFAAAFDHYLAEALRDADRAAATS